MITRLFTAAILACAAFHCFGKAQPAYYPDLLKLSAGLYAEAPDLEKCQAGRLHNSEQEHVLNTINTIRALHGLAHVVFDKKAEYSVKQASLMFAANGQILHSPPATWQCYSAEGALAASNSIISGGVAAKNIAFFTPEMDIIAWLTDINSINPDAIGHRRILLDPFLQRVAYGRVSGRINRRNVSVGSALSITSDNNTPLVVSTTEIIAYPYHDYPSRFFVDGTVLSFSLLIDHSQKRGNALVDFSKARIRVFSETGTKQNIKHSQFDNKYYGLPNNLQFTLGHVEPGLRYEVRIDDVKINDTNKSYGYWFRIVSESDSKSHIIQ